jgi:isoamylase
VSYESKHNDANGEDNHDGTDDNRSWNCGVEGATDDPEVLALRRRQQRNLLATVLLSQGVPMLLGGDEIGRTQLGNNNAYAQDNETTWVHWELSARQRELLAFTRKCFNLRHSHAVLRRRHFFRGEPTVSGGAKDVSWIRPDGEELAGADWADGSNYAIGMLIWGDATDETDDRGRPIVGETLLLLFNGSADPLSFTLPTVDGGGIWTELVDTAERELRVVSTGCVGLEPFSLVMLRYGENRRVSDDQQRR